MSKFERLHNEIDKYKKERTALYLSYKAETNKLTQVINKLTEEIKSQQFENKKLMQEKEFQKFKLIAEMYNKEKKAQGFTRAQALQNVADKFNVGKWKVERAVCWCNYWQEKR
jgi:response regulator of citrate/malate metabolism